MSDYSSLKVWHKDEIERLIKAVHTASAAARPGLDEYRAGHTAALVAICEAAGIDLRARGVFPGAPARVFDLQQEIIDQNKCW